MILMFATLFTYGQARGQHLNAKLLPPNLSNYHSFHFKLIIVFSVNGAPHFMMVYKL